MSPQKKPVDRLRKIGLSETLANYLAGKGVSSVMQLANMSFAALTETLSGADLDGNTISGIRRIAAVMRSLVNNHLMTVHGQVSPSYKALPSTNENNNIIDFHEGMESYPEMFGDPSYFNISEFDSVLSPAAYLVDLMRYINDYIVQPPNPQDKPLLLQSRRPDIWKIPLDKENTLNETQYLELVNEILQTKLDDEGKVDADGTINENDKIGNALRYMAEAIFPFNLPFNAPVEKIRQYLGALQTQLYDIYQTFHIDPQAQAREYLKLSPEQVAYLITPLPNSESLNLAFGNINTANPKPHFTGIKYDADLGSLNNAEVFMNQLGFSETNELRSLFYQNINTDLAGANTLLNNLFINKSSNQYHLAYSTANTDADWADTYVWEDASYYSTIQRVVANGELYLLVRTKTGIDTWQFNTSHQNWVRLSTATPAWSDDNGWNLEPYYSTIQAVASDSQIFLLGRFTDGMQTWVFDIASNTWSSKQVLDPLSDALGWNQPQYFWTIKTVYAHDYVFLVGRFSDGIHTWYFNPSLDLWGALIRGTYNPDWTDAAGWNQPQCYMTIKLIMANEQMVIIGKALDWVETYALYFRNDAPLAWLPASIFPPDWGQSNGWNNPSQYMTIHTCVIDHTAYLVGCGNAGIEVYTLTTLDGFSFLWLPFEVNTPPNWNQADWQTPSCYLTLRVVPLGKNIMLVGRNARGIQTWILDLSRLLWSQVQADFPAWSDAAGWNDPSYYTGIHAVAMDNMVILFGTTKTAIETWRYSIATQTWVKKDMIRAVIELENNTLYANLNMAVLDRVNRFIRLSKIIGWQYEDLDWALLAAQAEDVTSDAIASLKDLHWIMDTLNLTACQVTAFWNDIKTYGEGYGPVSQAPFDIVFNQPLPFVKKSTSTVHRLFEDLYHPKYAPNPNYLDDPVIWQTDGKSASAHSIILRLMGALNLDARNLKALADHFIGSGIYSSPNAISLTVQNLSAFYRYALLANSLRLSIPELIVLMQFLDIRSQLSFSSSDTIRMVTCRQWMTGNSLNVYQLNYIINTVSSKSVNPGFDLLKVPAMLKSLADAATQWYLNTSQLQFEPLMTELISKSFYNTLSYKKYIDDRGIILKNDFTFPDISDCFACHEMKFTNQQQLISVCSVGNETGSTASQVRIPFNANKVPPRQPAWKGAVSIWFRYDGSQMNTCTLYCLYNTVDAASITLVQLSSGNIILTAQGKPAQTIYKMPSGSQWHLLVISYAEQSMSLDNLPVVPGLTGLQIPTNTICAVAIGQTSDSFVTAVAELRLFDGDTKLADIVNELYTANHSSGTIKGNSNYWPLNEGQGVETAKDIEGDLNGSYAGKAVWNIVYNTVIQGFSYLDSNGHLTAAFDPSDNTPANQPFIELWKTIANLRNILNKAISTQKQGALQKLADYYQLNKDLTLYADYIAAKDELPNYVQTLLAYRFSLSWLEFSLDLDRTTPFISSYLQDQFAANKIVISAGASITRLVDDDGNLTFKWLIKASNEEVFFLDKRDEALDIFKLLPGSETAIFPVDEPYNTYSDYLKFNIDKNFQRDKPGVFFSNSDAQFVALLKKDNYVRITIHDMPQTGKDVVSRINTFISDLGQLLYTIKTLKLSDEEFASIVDNTARFFPPLIGSKGIFSLSQLQAILLFRKLNTAYVREDMSFAKYFYLADDMGSLTDYVAKLTEWDAQGLRQLSEWNCPYQQFAAINILTELNTTAVAVGAGSNYAIIGYPLSKSVFVYQLEGEQWEGLPGVPAPTGAAFFGATVTIQNYFDGFKTTLRAIIADTTANDGKGIVYIYEYSNDKKAWGEPVTLSAQDGANGDAFGSAVATYDKTIAIGTPNAGTTHSGKVYIFKYISGQWTDKGINFTVQSNDTLFGSSVSLYDDIVAVGSANYGYIFNISSSSAVPLAPPVPSKNAKVMTNGDFAVISQMSGSPLINYISGISSPTSSGVQALVNAAFSGTCTIAIEDDTLIVNDSTNTCFVYYIQDNILSFRQTFALSSSVSDLPWPIALADGNLIIGQVNPGTATILFYGTKHDINWFGFADECFTLADKLGVSIGTLLGFINLAQLALQVRTTSNNNGPDNNNFVYASYEDYANKLAGALSRGRTPDEWDTIYGPLRNKFLERERDALAGYMIFSLRNVFSDINNINDLYELLLIDVGSGGCRSISKIKAALNSLQLYIERCRMQLEPFAGIRGEDQVQNAALDASAVEWSWMSQYRVWEANREVFLFPEKYFDPTLRKDKTSAYAELQNKLSQANLTNNNATEAFQSYFHDLENLATLTVVASCMGYISSFINGRIITKNTFYVFGRTKNSDEGYYYRTADAIFPTDLADTWINWSNWEKIGISIKADSVACVYASGRPFLFWLEFTKQQVTGDDATYNSSKSFRYETKVYYSFQNSNGQWANPHEVPMGSVFGFKVTPMQNMVVTLPSSPAINYLNSFLGVADLRINFTVQGGTPDPKSPLVIPIDNILNLNERYMWTLNNATTDLRGNNSLGIAGGGASFQKGTAMFSNRDVLSLNNYVKGLTLPLYFNTWFNESFTLGLWINGRIGNNASYPLLYAPPATKPNQFTFQITNGSVAFGVGTQVLASNTKMQQGSWFFIVLRYNSKTFEQSIFINGILDNRQFFKYDLQGSAQYLFMSDGNTGLQSEVADVFSIHSPMQDPDILSIYKQYINADISDEIENYEWQLDGNFNELQGDPNNALTPTMLVNFLEALDPPFTNGRQVVNLNAFNWQFMMLPNHFNTFLNHSFTVGIWIFAQDYPTGDWPILASSQLTPGQLLCMTVRNSVAYIDFYNSSTTGTKVLSSKAWHFVVFTYDEASKTQSIYVDGAFDTSSSGHLPYDGDSQLRLGVFNSSYANGLMADLLLANDALSGAEIAAIYHTINQSPPVPADNILYLNSIQDKNAGRIQQLSEDLFIGGPDYLYGKNSVGVTYSELSAKASYGKYMWELFYHIPMLVGQLLSGNQQFKDAKAWYEYIFNPTAADKSNDRFWQLGYFRSLGKPEDIVQILTDNSAKDEEQLLIYDFDPFDPEAIAYLRPGAFEKKTVLNYISNLLDWGDSLFSQYTWETLTEAEMLYVLAKELLGKRADIMGSFTKKTSMNIAQIETEYPGRIPQFIIDIEDMQLALHSEVQATLQHSASVSHFYFGIPENDDLPKYQDLVDTRLFEIRNCLNIIGQQQSLALFEPAINPMMLVAAGAAGLNLANVPISYAIDIPNYRFEKMIEYAKAMAERVMDFGRQILGVLEKNDEEQLALLRIIQERTILDLTTSIKEKAIEEATNQGLVLEQSLASANERISYYTMMLAMPVSVLEAEALQLNQLAIAIEGPASGLHVAAVVGHLVPTVFGFADGDFSPGGSIESAASALSSASNLANNTANMTAVSASYSRRLEDWDLQLKLAKYEAASIGIQQTINDIALQSATADLAIHIQQITDNEKLQDFYSSKFTNKELYQWMVDQISSVHYQAFQVAQDLARKAQIAYQFELNTSETFISYGYWDSTRRGLLSGEKLVSDLGRLEKAYSDNNVRSLEIQKIVSLKDISITELDKLIKTGSCKISLTEQLYDWDFPGHYNRKIKSVYITIPAIVGPYQSIKASLVQLSNKVVAQPDLKTVTFLASNHKNQTPSGNALRVNWRPNQQIAISKASGDTGLFELNFNDERYLPFEGTGAVSDWQLSIPQATNAFDLNTISDVIMYINYTAWDGGNEFRQQVINLPEIKNYNGVLVVSIKQEFNQSWNTFMTTGTGVFSVGNLQFPPNLRLPVNIDEQNVEMIYRTLSGKNDGIKVNLTFDDPAAGDWEINFDSSKRSELVDILLEIPYAAELK